MRTILRFGLSLFALVLIAGGTLLLIDSAAEAHDDHNTTAPKAESASSDRAWLGVSLTDLDDDFRERWDYSDRVRGALISEVRDDSPADDAGLRRYDLVTRVNRDRVRDSDDLIDLMRDQKPGDTVTLELLRKGEEKTVTVTLADWPQRRAVGVFGDNRWFGDDRDHAHRDHDDAEPRDHWFGDDGDASVWMDANHGDVFVMKKNGDVVTIQNGDDAVIELKDVDRVERKDRKVYVYRDGQDEPTVIDLEKDRDSANTFTPRSSTSRRSRGPSRAFLGVMSQGLNDQLGEYFGVEDGQGVLVTEVVEDSPAATIGLKAGDVIVAVGETSVENSADLTRAIRRYDAEESVEITVVRNRNRRTFRATLGDARDFSSLENLHFKPNTFAFGGDDHLFGLDDEHLQELHEHLRRLHDDVAPEIHQQLRGLQQDLGPEIREHLRQAERKLREAQRGLHRGLRETQRDDRLEDDARGFHDPAPQFPRALRVSTPAQRVNAFHTSPDRVRTLDPVFPLEMDSRRHVD